jgi:voltage-gated potassium channel Kch
MYVKIYVPIFIDDFSFSINMRIVWMFNIHIQWIDMYMHIYIYIYICIYIYIYIYIIIGFLIMGVCSGLLYLLSGYVGSVFSPDKDIQFRVVQLAPIICGFQVNINTCIYI